MNKTQMLKIHQNIDKLIASGRLEGKTILLFGANKTADMMCSYLGFNGKTVTAIIDNSPEKWGKTICGVCVCAPYEMLSGKDNKSIIILIASKYYREMKRSVLKYGLKDENFAQTLIFMEYSVSQKAFESAVKTVMDGFSVYCKIKEQYGENLSIILNPTPSMGDSFFIFTYVGEYVKMNGIKNYVVAVTGGASVKVADMFGVFPYISITQSENDALLTFASFTAPCDVKIVSYAVPHTNLLTPFYGTGKLNWGDMIRGVVLGLPKSAPKARTKIKPEKKEEFYAANGFEKCKTAILAPFAVTAQSLPDTFWSGICTELSKKGYKVFINEAPEEHTKVKGAKQVFIPLENICQTAEYAGVFISVRSGICDVLSTSKANVITVYPDNDFFKFFGMKKIGIADKGAGNLTEIVYESDEKTIQKALEMVSE